MLVQHSSGAQAGTFALRTADVAAAMQQMGIVGFVEAMHQQMDEMEHRLDSAIDGPQPATF